MKNSELITILQSLPQDALVVLSKDAEGNFYSPMDDATVGMYEHGENGCGEFYDSDEEPDGVPDGSVRAICLWPIG